MFGDITGELLKELGGLRGGLPGGELLEERSENYRAVRAKYNDQQQHYLHQAPLDPRPDPQGHSSQTLAVVYCALCFPDGGLTIACHIQPLEDERCAVVYGRIDAADGGYTFEYSPPLPQNGDVVYEPKVMGMRKNKFAVGDRVQGARAGKSPGTPRKHLTASLCASPTSEPIYGDHVGQALPFRARRCKEPGGPRTQNGTRIPRLRSMAPSRAISSQR